MSLPNFYVHYCPTKILAGQLALSNLTFEMQRLGGSRALVVIEGSQAGSLALGRIRQAYRDAGAALSEFTMNSPQATVGQAREVAERFKRDKCDCLIALGSAAPMHLAKAAGIIASGRSLQEFSGRGKLTAALPLLLAVPTVYSEGLQVSSFCQIFDEAAQAEIFIQSEQLYPHLAVLDPINCLKAAKPQALFYGLDALSLALQAYLGTDNPVVRIYALAAIELVRKYLLPAIAKPSEREASLALANASLYAGIAFSNEASGPLAALAATQRCPELNAALLPAWLSFEAGRNPEDVLSLTAVLGGSAYHLNPANLATVPVELIDKLCSEAASAAGVALSLKALGLQGKRLAELAEATLKSPLAGDFAADDLLALLQQA